MEKLLQIILNEYIPKNKINKFCKLISEYGFNNLTYCQEEKELKIDYFKIPIDILKQRLHNKISEVEEPKVEEVDSNDQNTLLNKCDEFISKINNMNKRNKHYYYYFGYYLQRFKNIYIIENTVADFNKFIEVRYNIKKTKLCNYMRFYDLCQKYEILLTCDLTFSEIIHNTPEILKIIKSH